MCNVADVYRTHLRPEAAILRVPMNALTYTILTVLVDECYEPANSAYKVIIFDPYFTGQVTRNYIMTHALKRSPTSRCQASK